jgi:hypothetical protein
MKVLVVDLVDPKPVGAAADGAQASWMRSRVACSACGAHRDVRNAPRCFVCGEESCVVIPADCGE